MVTAASISLLVFLAMGERSVYAQAIAAIVKAHSVHGVALTFDREGNQTSDRTEIWYDASRGVREELSHPHVRSTRIDNGTHEWKYRGKANTVVKGPSRDPVGMVKNVINALKMIEKYGYKLEESASGRQRVSELLTLCFGV